jgi:hypothetical protein
VLLLPMSSRCQVDYLALSGLSGAQFAAVLGSSAQAMSTFSSMHSLIYGLLAGNSTTPPATGGVAQALVQAVYNRVKAVAPTNASQVRHIYADT